MFEKLLSFKKLIAAMHLVMINPKIIRDLNKDAG